MVNWKASFFFYLLSLICLIIFQHFSKDLCGVLPIIFLATHQIFLKLFFLLKKKKCFIGNLCNNLFQNFCRDYLGTIQTFFKRPRPANWGNFEFFFMGFYHRSLYYFLNLRLLKITLFLILVLLRNYFYILLQGFFLNSM